MLDELREALPGKEIFPISAATRKNIDPLLESLWKTLQRIKEEEAQATPTPTPD